MEIGLVEMLSGSLYWWVELGVISSSSTTPNASTGTFIFVQICYSVLQI